MNVEYYVFGDTGGHLWQLQESLMNIGMTDDYVLPADTTIIHMGDLVHKGPKSDELLLMIEKIRMRNQEGRWIQLIGNHEEQYLKGVEFWNPKIDDMSQLLLREWLADNFLKYVHVLDAGSMVRVDESSDMIRVDKPLLFTHAGVGPAFYDNFFKDVDMCDFDKVVKAMDKKTFNNLYGNMLGNGYRDKSFPVGPVWAHGIHEVWKNWDEMDSVPFSQCVGHIAPFMFNRNRFFPGTDYGFIKKVTLVNSSRIVFAPMSDGMMFFVDPGYGKYAEEEGQPYMTVVQ